MQIKKTVKQALEEDLGGGDVTSQSISSPQDLSQGYLLVKENGVIAGLEVAQTVFQTLDKKIVFTPQVKDGSRVKKGKVIAKIKGSILSMRFS